MHTEWKRTEGKYASGHSYCVGENLTIVGTTHRATGNKSESNAPLWVSSIKLPGIKQSHKRFDTEEQAMQDVELRVKVWFKWMK